MTRFTIFRRTVWPAALGAVAAALLVVPASADPTDLIAPGPPPGPVDAPVVPAAADVAPAAPTEVAHLSSPDNLPPGTTAAPEQQPEGVRLGYLRELWHAYQTQEVSGGDALLLLTQRSMDAGPATTRMPTGPQSQPESQPEPAPAPAPEPVADPAPQPAGD